MNFNGSLPNLPDRQNKISEQYYSFDEQAKKQKLFKKQETISSLVKNIQRPHFPVTRKKLCAKLSIEVKKLSHLVDDPTLKILTESERKEAVNSLHLAKECLESATETSSPHEPVNTLPIWLKDDIVVSPSQATHIVGDTFAQAADLEGGTAEEMLSIALELLTERPDFISETEWKSVIDLLQNACTIDREVFAGIKNLLQMMGYGFIDRLNIHIDSSVEKLSQFVGEALKNNQAILIPGGWTGEPAGHAMYYKIEPQENGKFTFQLYNRGVGIGYHGSVNLEFQSLFEAFIEKTDISGEKLLDPHFLRAIIEQRCFAINPYSGTSSSTGYSAADIYEPLLEMLQGKCKAKNVEMEELMSPQRTGTCSWKSLTAVFRAILGYLPSKQLKLRMETQAVWSFYLTNKDKLATDVFSRNLLTQLVTAAAETMETSKKCISEKEYLQLTAMFVSIEKQIKAAKSEALKDQANHISSSLSVREPLKLLPTASEYQIDNMSKHPLLYPCFNFPGKGVELDSNSIEVHDDRINLPEELNKWQIRPDTLGEDLIKFSQLCKEAIHRNQHQEVNAFFLQVMRHLPVPTTNFSTEAGKFWKQVIEGHKDEIPQIMEAVAHFSNDYYTSCFYVEGSLACPPQRTHAVIKALHIQNILKNHSPLAEMGFKMPSEFVYLEQLFSDLSVNEKLVREMGFRSTDPIITEELEAIYQDLKLLAAPYEQTRVTTNGIITKTGLAFEWFDSTTYARQFDEMKVSFSENMASHPWISSPLNPEFAFIREKLLDKEFFAKASKCYARLNAESFEMLKTCEKIAFVYCNGAAKLLPPLFLQWRSQILQSGLLLYGPFAPPLTTKIESPDELVPHLRYKTQNDKSFEVNGVDISPDYPHALRDKNKDYGNGRYGLIEERFERRYLHNLRPLSSESVNKMIELWRKDRNRTQNDVYGQEFPNIAMPLHQTRELLNLGTNKQLQVEQTIAYFSENIHLLAERDYQTLFHLLLFEENLLLKELKNHPEIIIYLDNLVKHGYELASDSADMESCVFYINLSRHLTSFIKHVYPEKNENLLSVQTTLNDLLSITGLTLEDKSLLYQELLASYSSTKSIKREDAVLIMRALTYLSMNPVRPEAVLPDIVQEQREVMFNLGIKILEMEDINALFNEALQPIIPDFKPGIWKASSSPIFISDQGFALNVSTGDFFEKNQTKASLPFKITNHPSYQRVFDRIYGAKQIDAKSYEFMDKNDDKYRITMGEYQSIVIQREINDDWHELIPTHKAVEIFNKAVGRWNFCWASSDGSRIELYDYRDSKTPKSFAINTNNTGVIKAKDNKGIKFTYVEFKRYPDGIFGEELNWTEPSILQNSTLSCLAGFEDPSYINVWRNKDQIPCLIEFPRHDIKFRLETKDSKTPRWVSSSFPGYSLASSQFLPALGSLKGYLVLENKKGQIQVIFPVRPLEDEKDSSKKVGIHKNAVFSEIIIFNNSLDEFSQRYLSYHLKPKGSSGHFIIEPSNAEAGLYLAYLKLATGQYDEARYLLSLHKLPLRGDCVNELDWLSKTIMLEKINRDNTGQGAALRLHAAYIYIELLQRAGRQADENEDLWKQVSKDAALYVNQIFTVGAQRLPLHEEQLVIRTLLEKTLNNGSISVYLLNYLKEIDPECSSEYEGNLLIKIQRVDAYFSFNPKDNQAQKHIFEVVNEACKTPPETWGDWRWFSRYRDSYTEQEKPSYTIKNAMDIPFLYTRPGEDGVTAMLLRWFKTPEGKEKQALLKEIRVCLALSIHEDLPLGHIPRALLEMISRYPNKYSFSVPPERSKNYDDDDSKAQMIGWVNKQILPILKDYVKEMQDAMALPRGLPKMTLNVSSKQNPNSLRKKRLPEHSSGYVKALPESLFQRQTNIVENKGSAFDPHEYFMPINSDQFKQIVEKKVKDVEETSRITDELFSEKNALNRCQANEYSRLRHDAAEHVKIAKKDALEGLKVDLPQENLPELSEKLELEIRSLKMALTERERVLLQLINPPQEIAGTAEAVLATPFLSGQRQKIGIDKLILLYSRGQLNELARPPTEFTKEGIEDLKNQITEYLEQATFIQQYERALNTTEVCLKQIKKVGKADAEEKQKIAVELNHKRQFKPAEHPEWLVLEYWANMLMRADQRDKLEVFFNTGDIQPILQMIMGAGKTSVLMVLMALFLADGKHLAALVVPEELFESVFDEIKVKLGEGFMQMIFPFNYARNSDYSVKGLRALERKLKKIIKNKDCLIASPKSYHCFYLKFIETWRAMHGIHGEAYVELKEQFRAMRDILNIFRKEGLVLMDEVDLILNCRNETNFPIGNLASIKERDMDVLLEMYDILLNSGALKSYLKAEFDPRIDKEGVGKVNKSVPFEAEFYHAKLKKPLADELLAKFTDPERMIGDPEMTKRIREFFKTADTEKLIQYLCHDDQSFDAAYDYVESIKDRDVSNILHLLHQELNVLLPFSLQKDSDEDYGVRTQLFATPLNKGKPLMTMENGRPVESTRYADPFESANYTFQSYYKTGIPITLVKQHVESLQKQAISDLKQGIALKDSSGYQAFCELTGKNKHMHLLKLSEQDIELIAEHVNDTKSLRNLFLKRYVFSAIHFQTRKLNSNGQMLGSIFGRSYGFSGTTWNSKTYHDNLTTIPSLGTDARTIFALVGRAGRGHEVDIVDFAEPMEFIAKLPCMQRELALIDNGAYLKGESILKEAKALLHRFHDSSIKGVVFFDEQDRKVILERGSLHPIPLKDSRLKPEQRFTIYTKAFTTGADILQSPTAIAYFTVGRNLLLRDYLQSVFRMRKIDQTQEIRHLVSSEVQKVINAQQKRDPEAPIKVVDIIIFSAYNQANQIGDDNYVSIKQKMLGVIQEEILSILLNDDSNIDELAKMYTDAMEELFAPSTGEEPCELYGGKESKESAEKVLEKDAAHSIKLASKVLDSSPFLKKQIKGQSLTTKIEKKMDSSIVPEELVWRENDNHSQLVQVQQETQTQQQTQTQTMQLTQSEPSREKLATWRYFSWPVTEKTGGGIFDSDFYNPDWLMNPHKRQWSPIDATLQSFWNLTTSLSGMASNAVSKLAEKSWSYLPEKIRDYTSIYGEKILGPLQESYHAPPWTYPLREFLMQNPELQPMLSLFDDKEFKVSFNFAPNKVFNKNDRLAIPFDKDQKPIQHLLIAYDEKSFAWEIMVFDQREAGEFRQELIESKSENYVKPIARGDLSLCLYDINLGVIESGRFSPTSEILEDTKLHLLLTKIKFLNGANTYSKSEIALLKEWISPDKWREIKGVYSRVILARTTNSAMLLNKLDTIFTG